MHDERAQQVCSAVYLLVLNMKLCAMVGVQQGCVPQGWGSESLQGRGVGLQQGVPMGVGGEAMVEGVRAGGEGSVRKGVYVSLKGAAAVRQGVGTSAAGKTS